MSRSRKSLFLISILILSVSTGCSINRLTRGIMLDLSSALFCQPDPEMAKDGSASFLLIIDGLIKHSPENQDLLLAGIKGYSSYALAFTLETDKNRSFVLLNHALNYGNDLLRIRFDGMDFRKSRTGTIEKTLKSATLDDVPALFWTAQAWSGWIVSNPDKMLALADLSKVLLLMGRVLELNPGYQSGGAELFFGIYYVAKPIALGGKPEKSLAHFQNAMRYAGDQALMPKVLFAQYYARAVFDQELFEKTLRDVINAPPHQDPELNLMNAIAIRKAQHLLKQMDEFF